VETDKAGKVNADKFYKKFEKNQLDSLHKRVINDDGLPKLG
jgi:ribosomal protein L15E